MTDPTKLADAENPMEADNQKHYAMAIICGAKLGPKDDDLTFSPASFRDFLKELAQPAPEQYTALQQALTRLQKRYGELEGKLAACEGNSHRMGVLGQ